MRILLVSFLIIAAAQKTFADLNECNPTVLKELSNRYAATLLCSSLDPQNFQTCLAALSVGGVGLNLTGWYIKTDVTGKLADVAAQLRMSKHRKYLSAEAEKLIENLIARKDVASNTNRLIMELRNHRRLYSDQITKFTAGLHRLRLGSILKLAGRLGIVGAVLEASLTPTDNCKDLTWNEVEKRDNQWIQFGFNCSHHVNPAYFEESFENQLEIVRRSPGLCKSISTFGEELDALAKKFLPETPPLLDVDVTADSNASR